jgi:hypothetical protein
MTEKIIAFPRQDAFKRLAKIDRMDFLLRLVLHLAIDADVWPQDYGAHVVAMPIGLLYPLYQNKLNRVYLASVSHDIITVEHRPAEDEAIDKVLLQAIWKQRQRVTLSYAHKSIMNAEKRALKHAFASMPIIDVTGYVAHVVDETFVLREMQKLLGSWGIIISTTMIKRELRFIEYAYLQSEAMGYPVSFAKDVLLRNALKQAA